jgi:hypothetical protein
VIRLLLVLGLICHTAHLRRVDLGTRTSRRIRRQFYSTGTRVKPRQPKPAPAMAQAELEIAA